MIFLLATRDNRSKPFVLQILYTVSMKMNKSKMNSARYASPIPEIGQGHDIKLHANVI